MDALGQIARDQWRPNQLSRPGRLSSRSEGYSRGASGLLFIINDDAALDVTPVHAGEDVVDVL